jgi:hypothetical protein
MMAINHIPSPSAPPFTFLPPTSTPTHIHTLYIFHSPVFHFKFQIQCSKGFLHVSQLWLYCTLVSSVPSVTLPCLFSLIPYYSTAFSTYLYILCLHRCNVFRYCWLLFSFPFPPPPNSIELFYYYKHVLHLNLYMIMFVLVYMFISWIIFHMQPLSFWTWLTSFNMTLSDCFHLPSNHMVSFFLMTE